MKPIPIVFATDNNGVCQLLVSLFCLLKNKKPETNYRILVLTKDLSTDNRINLQKINDTFVNSTIEFHDCKEYEDKYKLSEIDTNKGILRSHKWPSPTYYRLLTPLFVSDNEKAIYLDIDVLVKIDLTELYEYPIQGFLAGVKNHAVAGWISWVNDNIRAKTPVEKRWEYEHFNTGTTEYDDYVQSGVLVFNLNEWQNINFDKLFAIAYQKGFNDEDLFNYVFKKNMTILPDQYNYCLHLVDNNCDDKFEKWFKTPHDKFDDFFNEAKLIHFSLKQKPDFVLNYSSYFLVDIAGGIDHYLNLLKDFDKYSVMYGLNENKQFCANMARVIELYNKIASATSKNNIIRKAYPIWFRYAYALYKELGIKA